MSDFILVVEDLNWISRRITKEMEKDLVLKENVYEWLQQQRLDLERLKKHYQEAIIPGGNNGEFFAFTDWFYTCRPIDQTGGKYVQF